MQNDPELERMRSYIRQMEDEIVQLKKQLANSQGAKSVHSMHSAGVQK